MTYSIIGTGNMARFLLRRLSQCGHTCAGIWGRTRDKSLALAAEWNVPVYTELAAINDGPDVCFLAVSDDVIGEVATRLSFRSTILIHHSGTADIRQLASGAQHCGVLWPVYSILADSPQPHNSFPVVWESNTDHAKKTVSSLAGEIGTAGYEATTELRRVLHLAAVFANNFTNHLIGVAQSICASRQLPPALLMPILQQTFERAQWAPAATLQTGPAKRGDEATMEAHRTMLAAQPDWLAIYSTLSASIAGAHRMNTVVGNSA